MKYMKTLRTMTVVLLTAALGACQGNTENDAEKEGVETVLPGQVNEVTVMTLKSQNFSHELVSNGKVTASAYSDLYFEKPEVVAQVWVKNGSFVRKGQKIAELDLFALQNTLAQHKNSLDQAELELQDVLIGQGYAPDQPEAVPADVMKLARVKSGYEQQAAIYEAAKHDLEKATLVAPFDGLVANLFQKVNNKASATDPFCRIVASQGMEVDFSVLESELPLVKMGDRVEIVPYAGTAGTFYGSISEINPLVDENGMVRVKARVNGGNGLFDGMNVRVSVQRDVKEQLVVPKSAVVLRSERQVVFTLVDGRAFWNYVQTGLENMDEYTITDGLQEGATVIVTGNVNLAHESPVKVLEN